MNYLYEHVKYDKNFPGKLLMQDKPGWRCNTMPHWHTEIEFLYMIEGKTSVTKEGTTQTINAGEFYFCNSKTIHSTKTPDNTSNYKYIVLLISMEFLQRFSSACVFQIPKGCVTDLLKEQLIKLSKLAEPGDAERFKGCPDIEKNKIILEICQILVTYCIVSDMKKVTKTFKHTGHAQKVMEYVSEHYQQPLTLPMVAKMAGLSPQYLSKYFKKVTDMSVTEYIGLVRLEFANKELISTNINVTEAALNNGFPNVKTYVRLCKNTYGMTPSEYRKAMRQE